MRGFVLYSAALYSVAAALTLSALPAQARDAMPAQMFPTPVQLSAAVDTAIARGGITAWSAKTLRAQAKDLVQLETRYARDSYSPREQREIARRSLYLVNTLIRVTTKPQQPLAYAGGGPFPTTRGDIIGQYARN